MNRELINPAFDYSKVSKDEESQLRYWEGELFRSRKRVADEMIKHGEILHEAQQTLAKHGSGTFQAWLASVGISTSSAYRAIDAFEAFGDCPTVGQIEVSALYVLAKNEKAKRKALKLVDKGVKVTQSMAQKLVAEAEKPKSNGQPKAADDPPFDEAEEVELPFLDEEMETHGSWAVNDAMNVTEPVTSPEACGRCPACLGTKWTTDDEGWNVCGKCGHPHGEPVGDVQENRLATQRSKLIKTIEATMREIDAIGTLRPPKTPDEKNAMENAKWLWGVAKGWK